MKEKQRPGRENKRIYLILAVVCAAGFLACAAWLAGYLADIKRADAQAESLREQYVQENSGGGGNGTATGSGDVPGDTPQSSPGGPSAGHEPAPSGEAALQESLEAERLALLEEYQVPEKEIDFAALQSEQNEDIYAWITVPGTKVDYPVLQHPEELDYYLGHNLDGTKGYPGCIYTQLMNSKDFTDKHTVLYGHNMSNGTMFNTLHYYEDPVFFEEHPYVYIYTPEAVLVYQVFAAYEFTSVHLLMGFDISTDEDFESYLHNVFTISGMNNNFNTELDGELTAEDRILTLSTCINGKPDKRWLVAAVLREEIPAAAADSSGETPEGESHAGGASVQGAT